MCLLEWLGKRRIGVSFPYQQAQRFRFFPARAKYGREEQRRKKQQASGHHRSSASVCGRFIDYTPANDGGQYFGLRDAMRIDFKDVLRNDDQIGELAWLYRSFRF